VRIDIRYNDGSLVINLDNAGECKTHLFTLDDDINLTSLVQDVSESESMLEIAPDEFEAFRSACDCGSKEMLKVAEYIYRIFDAFNQAYSEVYPDHIRKHEQALHVSASYLAP